MYSAIRKLQQRRADGEEGFTLIELLVVIIIIGILAAIAIPVFLNQRENGWRAAVQSDLRNAAVEQESYYTNNGEYTSDLADLDVVESANVTLAIVTPADAAAEANSTSFCMTGQHAQVDGNAVIFSYDSATGGLFDGDVC